MLPVFIRYWVLDVSFPSILQHALTIGHANCDEIQHSLVAGQPNRCSNRMTLAWNLAGEACALQNHPRRSLGFFGIDRAGRSVSECAP
jgi:hypothetical protein